MARIGYGEMAWVTVEWRIGSYMTRRYKDVKERGKYSPDRIRLASPEEIETAEAEERDRIERLCARNVFVSRPDYAIANHVRDILEVMEPGCHPLDALSLAEWEALRVKLQQALARAKEGQ